MSLLDLQFGKSSQPDLVCVPVRGARRRSTAVVVEPDAVDSGRSIPAQLGGDSGAKPLQFRGVRRVVDVSALPDAERLVEPVQHHIPRAFHLLDAVGQVDAPELV